MGPNRGFRARLMRAIHAEGKRRGLDHDALHAICLQQFQARSMADLSDAQLSGWYRHWTGKLLKSRAPRPVAGANDDLQLVSGEEMIDLSQQAAVRGLSHEGLINFIRRQLRGREVVRTRGDYRRVVRGLRAMNRREHLI